MVAAIKIRYWVDSSTSIHSRIDCRRQEKLPFQDNNLLTQRTLSDGKFKNQGDQIKISLREPNFYIYTVEINQDIYVEDDLTKSCSVYPTLQYTSYDQCDMEYVREKIAAVFGSDVIPIWATTDINNVTKQAHLTNNALSSKWIQPTSNYGYGILQSPCKLPCTSTRTTTQLSEVVSHELPFILVKFQDTIQVTRTDIVQFSLTTFLSNLGGSLGLWLGLGMVQLGEVLMQCAQVVCKWNQ